MTEYPGPWDYPTPESWLNHERDILLAFLRNLPIHIDVMGWGHPQYVHLGVDGSDEMIPVNDRAGQIIDAYLRERAATPRDDNRPPSGGEGEK